MKMNLGNVNLNKWSGIDLGAVKQVSAEIMQNANTKSVDLSKTNLTAFRRPELGVDLYSQKTSIDTQRQISLSNTNFGTQAPAAANFLNAQAATNIYSNNNVTKLVEGKMAPAITEGEADSLKAVFDLSRNLEVYSAQKDKKGSSNNPFAAASQNQESTNTAEGGLNIVG